MILATYKKDYSNYIFLIILCTFNQNIRTPHSIRMYITVQLGIQVYSVYSVFTGVPSSPIR